MHGGETLPGVVYVLVLYCYVLVGFCGITFIPNFVFAGILASEGFMMLDRFFITPYRIAGLSEGIPVSLIGIVSFFDFYIGFFLGCFIALLIYSIRFYHLGCVKQTGTGLTIRSTVDRDDKSSGNPELPQLRNLTRKSTQFNPEINLRLAL